jgi:anti-sigma B factor antagonist
MTIEIKESEKELYVGLTGRLDTAAAAEVSGEFERIGKSADRTIVLDCTNLEYISSSGLRLFLTLRKEASAKGGKVIVRKINDSIRNVFTMTGFYSLFEMED